EALGYGNFTNARDISALHISRAEKENLELLKGENAEAEAYDDHALHYTEHVRFLLSEEFASRGNEEAKKRIEEHMRKHKYYLSKEKGEV
ncbi:MAG: hypothetical protein J6Z36_01925, partial [Clostridia bacterium]|nr:hypothetical protein [Clostridia bacterium]